MLKVLAIYPAFDPAINEMAMVWKRLCDEGKVNLTVVAWAVDQLKGQSSESLIEKLPNLEIHRISSMPASAEGMSEVARITRASNPDVIFCAVTHNMPAAIEAQKIANAPIVLHTEYFIDDTMGLRRRAYLGLKFLRPWVHRRFRKRLLSQCDLIFCSNPIEFKAPLPPVLTDKLRYLPWPHPARSPDTGANGYKPDFSAYIGSISRAKGSNVLSDYFSALLTALPQFKLVLIGPATDDSGVETMEKLRAIGGNRVEIRKNCPREEALALIHQSLFILSPGKRLGWGLMGDAWSSGTPIIAAGHHYDIEPDKNCLIAEDSSTFVQQVRRLQTESGLREMLVSSGITTVSHHSLETVAATLFKGLHEAALNAKP